jgi:prepilin-type N-terminal cleavage/methylation domain-containing protein
MVLAESGGMHHRHAGFTVTELLLAIAIAGIVAAMALPATTRTLADFRLHGDARSLHNLLGVAKMRAAAKYTRSRVYVDLTAETFYLQTWDKTGAGAWVTEGAITPLSNDADFAFDGLASPPPDTQAAIQQAAPCLDDADAPIANTGCIVFNSRGIPINAAGNPDGNGAFYLTDHATGVYGITISMTPLVRLWWSPLTAADAWVRK